MMRILWYVSQLNQSGGGDRYALASSEVLTKNGHDVILACDILGSDASFDGRYDLSSVKNLGLSYADESSFVRKAIKKFFGIWLLVKLVRKERPEIIFCQSEYDAIRLMPVALIFNIPFRVHIFGQMYQFKSDLSKYSLIFRGHLKTIVSSCPGYKDMLVEYSVMRDPFTWFVNEAVSLLKYISVRKAEKIFVLSEQVRSEVRLLYKKEAIVLRGAIDYQDINVSAVSDPRRVSVAPRLLSVCRLEPKKRVDIIIQAFLASDCNGTLIVIGDGPERERLQKLAKYNENVIFLGRVSDFQRDEELEKCDCFISMDVSDFVITAIEAMAHGKRVIVSEEFDLNAIGPQVEGVERIPANIYRLASEIGELHLMNGPSDGNIDLLYQLTWQNLAKECVN